MTEAQKTYLNKLLYTLGFKSDKFIDIYLKSLTENFFKLKNLNQSANGRINNLFDFFKAEITLRRQKRFKRKNHSDRISATDISNYTYCPVSFSIAKTFELEKNPMMDLGEQQHHQHYLINYLRPFKRVIPAESHGQSDMEIDDQLSFKHFERDKNQQFIETLKNVELTYVGHSQNEGHFLVGSKGNYIAQPDYIFMDKRSKTHFVVEEKFFFDASAQKYFYDYRSSNRRISIGEPDSFAATQAYVRERSGVFFFENHKNQLRSYVFGIKDYAINCGYLLYWHYIYFGKPFVVGFDLLKISKAPNEKKLIGKVFSEIEDVLRRGGGDFSLLSRNPRKCGACSSNLICGHKTGRYNSYTVPYSEDYLKLW